LRNKYSNTVVVQKVTETEKERKREDCHCGCVKTSATMRKPFGKKVMMQRKATTGEGGWVNRKKLKLRHERQ
jgi:hypothetical protein